LTGLAGLLNHQFFVPAGGDHRGQTRLAPRPDDAKEPAP
jgi:hypothetical protein